MCLRSGLRERRRCSGKGRSGPRWPEQRCQETSASEARAGGQATATLKWSACCERPRPTRTVLTEPRHPARRLRRKEKLFVFCAFVAGRPRIHPPCAIWQMLSSSRLSCLLPKALECVNLLVPPPSPRHSLPHDSRDTSNTPSTPQPFNRSFWPPAHVIEVEYQKPGGGGTYNEAQDGGHLTIPAAYLG